MSLTKEELFSIALSDWLSGGFEITDYGVEGDTRTWMYKNKDYVIRQESYNQRLLNGYENKEELKNLDREFENIISSMSSKQPEVGSQLKSFKDICFK